MSLESLKNGRVYPLRPNSNCKSVQSKKMCREIVVDVDRSSFPQAQTFVASADHSLTVLDNGDEQIIAYELPADSNLSLIHI